MLRSLKRSLTITLAALGAAAVVTPLALAHRTPAATAVHHHHHKRAHVAAATCDTPGVNLRTCTIAPGQMPPMIGAIDGDQLAASGSIRIPVDVSGPGTVRAVSDLTKPSAATATHAGTVELTLTLTDAARAKLADGERLELLLEIKASNSPISIATVVPLAAS